MHAPGPRAVHPSVRYAELQPPERQLLLALEAQGGETTREALTDMVSGTPEDVLACLVRLTGLGLVHGTPTGWRLQEAVRRRVQQDLSMAVQARMVTSYPSRLRTAPGLMGERVLRYVCRELFTPHNVAAQVPLRRVLDVQVMNTLLDEGDRTFLASGSAHLDVVIEHHETEEPLLALELDGPQHERSPQQGRDVRKDRILRVAGLPLLRLWTDERRPPSAGLLRAYLSWRLREALRDRSFREAVSQALYSVLDRSNGEVRA
ncbi:hypothetical protein Dcar01_01828 [Deinococcus carri]|uniref:DUF2726 domain-containing protein n=1 Tax=Deinococcus carri TaxID=1211323 RepID=A0ABP9W6V6_9DEIO